MFTDDDAARLEMKGMESMVLPRIPASILENGSASQTHTVTLKPEAALDLPPAQQPRFPSSNFHA